MNIFGIIITHFYHYHRNDVNIGERVFIISEINIPYMGQSEEENDSFKRSVILKFLNSVERNLESGKNFIMSRFFDTLTDNVTYNITSRSFIQDGKKKYAVTLTLSLIVDEDDIVKTYENMMNLHDRVLNMVREQVEEEKKRADEYLKERKEKLRKMKSKDEFEKEN